MELGHAGADHAVPGREADGVGVRTWSMTDTLLTKQDISTKQKFILPVLLTRRPLLHSTRIITRKNPIRAVPKFQLDCTPVTSLLS